MELWTAFLLGLAGSAHCAGMCGPLVLALPVLGHGAWTRWAGRLLYSLGRMLTYGGLGLIFGLMGRAVALAGIQRWVSIGLGAVILAGLLGPRLPVATRLAAVPVSRLKSTLGHLLKSRRLGALFLFGGVNGLLPCGLVYVACAGAAATGGLLSGMEYMLAFGLGTVPMMLGLGLAGHMLQASLRVKLQKLVPFCLGALAVLLILRGLSLGIPYLSPGLAGSGPGLGCH